MSKVDITKLFATSFKHADGIGAHVYSSYIRFTAIMMVIIAMICCINHFMGTEEKHHEEFFIRFGSRIIRIVIGLCLFILILIVKGN